MNFLQLVQRLKRESGRSTTVSSPATFTTASVADLRLVDWVADAWRDLQQEPLRWRWQRGTVVAPLTVGVATYAPEALGITSFLEWKEENGDYAPSMFEVGQEQGEWELCFLPYDEFRACYTVVAQPDGQPMHWTIDTQNHFVVGPAPAKPVQLRADFERDHTELVAETDEPLIPVKFRLVLVWRALMELAAFDAAGEVYQRAQQNYAKVHKQLEEAEAERIVFQVSPLA